MIRHILIIQRMMFHHHILSRKDDETMKKIYYKQKEEYVKGDWFQLLINDFKFVGKEMNEEIIASYSKEAYKKIVKTLVNNAAFKLYKEKQETESKIKELKYEQFELKEYLSSELFSREERELLVMLRSKCYDVKANFRKMHQNKIECSFGCPEIEDQKHVFVNCQKLDNTHEVEYDYIDENAERQKKVMEVFVTVDKKRKQAVEALLPGGDPARTHATPSV